jgi:uncharacterized protein (TIGR03435 family)
MIHRALPLLFLVIAPLLVAQQPAPMPSSFAVATIKESKPDTTTLTQIRGNRFFTQGTTFIDLFKYAYNVHPDEVVGGPAWLRTQKFDVVADPETEKRPSSDQMKALMQQLLTARFHLTLHREQKVLPVYALVKGPDPLKLKPSTAAPDGIPAVGYDPTGTLEAINATMANLATFLQRFVLDRPAVDQTGIPGHFDLTLKWTPETTSSEPGQPTPAPDAPPGLFTAIREQLGLKLRPTKASVDIFVIDHADLPSED